MSEKELEFTDIALQSARFVKRRWWMLLLFLVVGIVVGGIQYAKDQIVYNGQLLVSSSVVPSPLMVNHINELGGFITNHQYLAFSKKIGYPEDQAILLKEISIAIIYDNQEQHYLLKIKSVGNREVIATCFEYLEAYLQKNAFIANEFMTKKAMLENEIAGKQNQISTLKNILNQMTKSGESSLIYADPSAVSSQILVLENEVLYTSKKLENLSVLEIIETVVIQDKPSLSKNLLASIIVFMSLGIALLLVYEVWKSIKFKL